MDSITHLSQKLLAERARNGTQQQPTPSTAPPPYSESDMASDDDSDDDDDDDSSSPVKLTLNAANNIQGCNNLVPTSATPLADATKFSTLLLHTVNQINAVANQPTARRRHLKVDLTINCGLTIVGDRNVVGHISLRPKAPNAATPPPTTSTAAVAGAKRKSEEPDPTEERAAKKVAGVKEGQSEE